MELRRAIKKLPSEQNLRLLSSLIISLANKVDSTSEKCINPFTPNTAYAKGSYVTHDNYIYESKIACNDADWVESHWVRLSDTIEELTVNDVKAMLNLSSEELANLQSLIDDTAITTTKTNSSSKIYMDIQAAIAECKDDTLKQIAKKVSGSYKIAASTSDVISSDYIYLINNGSNYDLYVLVDSVPTKVGDTTIDLSDYAKLTDLADYLKKTDAASTYATIATVDGKVDKTSILSSTSNTATDDQVYSASVVNTELDLKANKDEVVKKTNITTDIGGTSTDDKVPSAKAIFNSCIQGKIIDQSVIDTYGTEILKYPLGRWLIVPDNVAEKFKDLPVKQSGHIDITSIAYNDNNPWTAPFTYRVCSYVPYSGGNYVRKMESGGTAGVVSDTGWQRVCTTRVEDKTFNATSITSLSSKYTFIRVDGVVKNGFCMCTLGIRVVEPAPTFESITSDMPKPQKVYYSPPILNWSDADGLDTTSPLHITVAPDGYLRCEHGIAGKEYYVTVAYPIAE